MIPQSKGFRLSNSAPSSSFLLRFWKRSLQRRRTALMEFPRPNDSYPEKSKRKFKAPYVTRGLKTNTTDGFGNINLGSKRHKLKKDELLLNSLKATGAEQNDGKCKSRRGKRRRSSPKHEENPKEELEQQVPSSFAPPPNSKHRRKCEDAPRSNRPTLLEKLRLRLSGGHFRMLNEKLYTSSGNEAFHLFKNEPELFDVYHSGYQEQMSKWPEQPVNIIIKWLKSHDSSLVVADFGCGNASLSRGVENKVFSIDLISVDPSVIACDMSHTPLESKSVDVAVFCLSLMGTDYPSYLKEANRVLKPCGWLLVAEVRSRFDPNNGGAYPDKFLEAVKQLGFTFSSKDFSNKMFVLFYFKKRGDSALARKAIDWPELKPCLYKRR